MTDGTDRSNPTHGVRCYLGEMGRAGRVRGCRVGRASGEDAGGVLEELLEYGQPLRGLHAVDGAVVD